MLTPGKSRAPRNVMRIGFNSRSVSRSNSGVATEMRSRKRRRPSGGFGSAPSLFPASGKAYNYSTLISPGFEELESIELISKSI